MITSMVLALFIPVINKKIFTQLVSVLYLVVILGGLLNLWCLYSYSKKLKDTQCECSQGWERKFIHIYSTVVGILWIIGILPLFLCQELLL